VSAVLSDLLTGVTVSQAYRRDDLANIQRVRAFPLPLDTVLLGLQVKIGGPVLKRILGGSPAGCPSFQT